ncbi:TetR/AcrR family transcriptional regulator [Nonomuraea sp. NN258]|uniref:TetR/AcrR family transcriptional regulator n=1 Tax=Nonomuraea antri TaxID=2730852 RepID=UPI0015686C97|nr:TetR/AcrR family transcriptional regulator [Nonomuraea antri]NRQ31766.1 TetR/AcrR family transcriptional regulator [Nonomuraea antri]
MMTSRDQIMTAAIQHLNEDPTASMARLAEAVGVSRATLHRHFSSREELMIALGHRALEQWSQVQRAAGIIDAAASADPAAIERALGDLLTGLIEVADAYGFGLTDHAMAVNPDLLRRSDELEEHEIALFAAAQRAGLLHASLPPRWVSNVVYGLLVAVRESLRRGDVARRDVPRLLIDTFLHGTAPRGNS